MTNSAHSLLHRNPTLIALGVAMETETLSKNASVCLCVYCVCVGVCVCLFPGARSPGGLRQSKMVDILVFNTTCCCLF